jgi:small nuclear ribonucleoprotein (snRNP)-like protein
MNKENIHFLKSKIDNCTINIHCVDGEEIAAKVVSVSEAEKDIVCDIISTNRQEKYKNKQAACLIRYEEIESVS